MSATVGRAPAGPAGRSGPATGRPAPVGLPRLLAGLEGHGSAVGLDEHVDRWGLPPTSLGSALVDEVERSGLRGRGGAWFPVGAKWRSVHRSATRRPVVVANAAEGEPASGKDALLATRLPHLVLDGAVMAAGAVGATRVVVHVGERCAPPVVRAVEARRRYRLDPFDIEVVVAPDRFIAGQESAVVNTVVGRDPARPFFTGIRSVRERGVDGRPTLVQNIESLAHAALVARYGAAWFRQLGTLDSPGSTLLTVTGIWDEPQIIEAPLGLPLGEVLGVPASATSGIQGVLLGGYGGGWLGTAEAMAMPLTEEAAREHGSSLGAGVVVALPSGTCPLAEVSRITTYLEGEGAGQCGPCVNGLAGLAHVVEQLAFRPSTLHGGTAAIPTLCGLVEGRGACRHPDGVARFVRSAMRVFAEHAEVHLHRGPCHGAAAPFLPVPASGRLVGSWSPGR